MTHRVGVLALALLLVAGSCGGDGSGDPASQEVTVAFLRAVAGQPSTEPAILDELRAAGYVQGRNLTVLASDPDEAYPDREAAAQAVEGWVDEGVDLIIALSTTGAQVAADSAPDVEVLFLSNDPSASGLVEDEESPEGQMTGATYRVPADRTLALARRAVPGLRRVGLAFPPSDPAALANRDALQAAADELGIDLVTRTFTGPDDVDTAIQAIAESGVHALVISTSPSASRAIAETAAAADATRLPVVANTNLASFALLSLAPDPETLGRQLGRQAARLLRGAAPDAVPVEDPSRFVLTVNAVVARELGLELDESLLREADAVIQ